MNPFAPLLGFLGASAFGRRSKKRRRKQESSNTNGDSTQRKSSRALDIFRIQRGLPRNGQDPSPQTASEVAESPSISVESLSGSIPDGVPPLRISKVIGTDTIGMTSDGKRGYVGPQWWSRQGRNLLSQIRRRHPGATPEESLLLLLKQAVPSVEWGDEDLPRGAHMLSRRLRRLVEAAYMGREVEVRPQEAEEAEEAVELPEKSPESPAEAPAGMPFAPLPEDLEGPVTSSVSSGIEMSPESAAVATEACDPAEAGASAPVASESAQAPQDAQKTRRGGRGRGGRRGGKKDRKAAQAEAAQAEVAQAEVVQAEDDVAVSASQEDAHATPEGDGGGASEGDGGDGGNSQDDSRSDVPEAQADASSSEQ